MPDISENLMEEWKSLREEIGRKQEFAGRLVLTTTAGNLAIYSFAFSWKELSPMNAIVALLPVFLTTICYFWILRDLYSSLRIVKYIRSEIEDPKKGPFWETWVWNSRLGKHPARNEGVGASSNPGEEEGMDEEIDTGGNITWWDDVYGLFYHAFLGVSLLVCIVLIWMPHWPYRSNSIQGGSGSTQLPQASAGTCLWLTLGAVLFLIIWYFIAEKLLIGKRKEKIQDINKSF